MAGDLRVAPEELQAVAAQLSSGASEVEALLAHLTSAVAPLLSGWTGSAQVQFDDLWSQWERDATTMREALISLSELAARAAQAYASTESAITGTFRQT